MNLRNLRYGEGVLWLGFAVLVAAHIDGGVEDASMLAGLFALSAIGVRATRSEPEAAVDDKD